MAIPQAGRTGNLDSITAVVLGGTSLFGGRGQILGTLIGALIVGVFRNGLQLMGVGSIYQVLITGVLVIAGGVRRLPLPPQQVASREARDEWFHSPGKVLFEMKGIGKTFPGVKALEGVSLTVREGQVHALLGENGAGKSTLIKILSGAYTKDEGEILFEGKPVEIRGPQDAAGAGHLDDLPGVQPRPRPHRRREHLPRPPAHEGRPG